MATYDLTKLKILVVDDNSNMRSLIASILKAFNCQEMHESETVEDAREILRDVEVDVVITDWHMLPEDGLDLVRYLRYDDESPNKYIPIIMLTGFSEYDRVLEARDAGVNEFLAKPIAPKSLYLRLASIIDSPREFIETETYFGPCRRRRDLGPPPGVEERRASAVETVDLDDVSAADSA